MGRTDLLQPIRFENEYDKHIEGSFQCFIYYDYHYFVSIALISKDHKPILPLNSSEAMLVESGLQVQPSVIYHKISLRSTQRVQTNHHQN